MSAAADPAPAPVISTTSSNSTSSHLSSSSSSTTTSPKAPLGPDGWPILFEPLKETLDKYKDLIASTRALLTSGQPSNDLTIYRFLRGWGMQPDKAAERINMMMAFRQAVQLDAIREKATGITQMQFPFADKFCKCYPHNITHSYDIRGQPVSVERIGLANPTLLTKTMKLDEIMAYHYYHMEHKAAMVEKLSYNSNIIVRTCKILDLSGLGRQHLNRQGLGYLKQIISVSQDNYPEMLGSLYVVNAPWVFELVWKAVKPWLNENTLSKINILGADYQTTLKSNVPVDNLPQFFGGNCTCAATSGCVPQIDPNAGMTKVTVAARGTHSVEVIVTDADLGSAGASVFWEFRTESYNIGFAYNFVAKDGVTVVKQEEAKKYDSDKDLICGSISMTQAGKLTLTWDNTFSRFTSKSLLFMHEVIKRDTENEVDISVSEAMTSPQSPVAHEPTFAGVEEGDEPSSSPNNS